MLCWELTGGDRKVHGCRKSRMKHGAATATPRHKPESWRGTEMRKIFQVVRMGRGKGCLLSATCPDVCFMPAYSDSNETPPCLPPGNSSKHIPLIYISFIKHRLSLSPTVPSVPLPPNSSLARPCPFVYCLLQTVETTWRHVPTAMSSFAMA